MDETHAIEAFAALAQPTRLKVFRMLIEAGPVGVPAGSIADRLGVPHNTLSTHLAVLSRAGLVHGRRESRSIIYAADFAGTRSLVDFLVSDCCSRQPEICAPLASAAGSGRP